MLSRKNRVEPKRELPFPLALAMTIPTVGALDSYLFASSLQSQFPRASRHRSGSRRPMPPTSCGTDGPPPSALASPLSFSRSWSPRFSPAPISLPFPISFAPSSKIFSMPSSRPCATSPKRVGKLLENGSLQTSPLHHSGCGRFSRLSSRFNPRLGPSLNFAANSNAFAFLLPVPP